MDFFRKVKNFVTGQAQPQQNSAPFDTSEPSSSHRSTAVVNRPQPVIQSAGFGAAGGVQGLTWYTNKLKQDRDGDVADEFLLERETQSSEAKQNSLQKQKRHLRSPKDPTVLVEGGNVYVVPST